MSETRATVLVPTHEHGELLGYAVDSVLRQTVGAIEVFIVLDGATPATVAAAERASQADERVRLFSFDKGERHGEAHRHVALQEATGRIVCYQSDDDLWAPDHVEYMEGLLVDADFAHSHAAVVLPGGEPYLRYVGDLGGRWFRDRLRSGANLFPLGVAAHTLEAYRALEVGWSPAPPTLPTDVHMWQKFLMTRGLKFNAGGRITALHFPTRRRVQVGHQERVEELREWHDRLSGPGAWDTLRAGLYESLPLDAALAFRLAYEEGHASSPAASTQVRMEMLEAKLERVQGSIAYRAARRLASLPIIGRVSRWAGRALARRGDR